MKLTQVIPLRWTKWPAPLAMAVDPSVPVAPARSHAAVRVEVSATGPRRVLVVEDSYMTARLLVRMVEDLGVKVIGPAPSVRQAMMLLDQERCDGAILDINLGNETVEPLAQRLADAGVPFFFVTGYSSPKFKEDRFSSHRLLHKPVDPGELKRAIAEAFGPGRA